MAEPAKPFNLTHVFLVTVTDQYQDLISIYTSNFVLHPLPTSHHSLDQHTEPPYPLSKHGKINSNTRHLVATTITTDKDARQNPARPPRPHHLLLPPTSSQSLPSPHLQKDQQPCPSTTKTTQLRDIVPDPITLDLPKHLLHTPARDFSMLMYFLRSWAPMEGYERCARGSMGHGCRKFVQRRGGADGERLLWCVRCEEHLRAIEESLAEDRERKTEGRAMRRNGRR